MIKPTENSSIGAAEAASEAAITAMTGIPPQIQRSFFKAFGRVFTAGAEIPAQWLEDRAEIGRARRRIEIERYKAEVADIKSEQKAREIIYRESARAAASQFKKEDLADRALSFHAAHIIREQQTREDVVRIAADCLVEDRIEQDSSNKIDDDWLWIFLKEASTRSQDEFKQMFGRILAGEIKMPGTFSIATIQSLGRLTADTAGVFQRACNLSSSGVLARSKIISDPFGNAETNSLQNFGLNYFELAILVEEGLIRSEFGEWQQISSVLYEQRIPFEHAGSIIFLAKDEAPEAPASPATFRISGPVFTRTGEELRRIVAMSPVEEYLKALALWFKGQGLILYKVVKEEGGQLYGHPVISEL